MWLRNKTNNNINNLIFFGGKRTPSQQPAIPPARWGQNRTEDVNFHTAPENSPHPQPTKRGFAPPQHSYTKIAPTLGFVLAWKLSSLPRGDVGMGLVGMCRWDPGTLNLYQS